jgi:hypothetical protein
MKTKKELEAMSDYEINFYVAELNYPNVSRVIGRTLTVKACGEDGKIIEVDYCNNWADMGPLILDSGISIDYDRTISNSHQWWCASCLQGFTADYTLRPLRGAAIVYILIKQAKQQ